MAIKFLNTVAVDTDVLYVDAASNEVGIGTTSPGSKLEVVEARSGSSASDQTHYTLVSKSTISSGTPGTGGIKVVYDDGSNEHAFGLVSGSSSADFLTSGPMHWYTNSDLNTHSATGFAMTIDTAQRVGIGLTNPSQKLTVSGNVMAGRYYSTGTTAYYLDPSDTTTAAYVAGPVRIRQSSSYQSTALEVTTATGSTGDDGVFIKNYWAGGPPTVSSKNPFLSIACADFSGHKASIYLGEDASPANQESKIEYNHDSAVLNISVKGQGSYREHVRFGNQGSSTPRTSFSGNVGIGTTSPDTKLHVEGNLLVDAYNVGEDNGIFLREGFLTIDQPSITVWDMSNSGASPDGLSLNANDGIRFRENGGEVARFKDGNFGIGESSPAERLHISGSVDNDDVAIRIDNDSDDNSSSTPPSAAVVFNTASNNGYVRVFGAPADTAANHKMDIGASASSSYLTFSPSGSEKMRIASSGNVGIGTASPRTKLDINGPLAVVGGTFTSGTSGADSSSSTGIVLRRGKKIFSGIPSSSNQDFYLRNLIEQDTGNNINIGQTGTSLIGNVTLSTGTSGNIIFRTTGSESVRIDSSGNVGINETSPQQKLHVGGRGLFETGGSTADATTSTYEKGITLTGGNMRLVIDTSNVSNAGSYIQTRHSSTTYPNAYYTLALNPLGGKVGIGTNSPSHKLEVVGDGVVVSDGTDQGIIYLRSDRTDTYIKENGNYQIETAAPSGILFECDSNSNGFGIFNIKRQGASRFYITDGGNVGIGTTSPAEKLTVSASDDVVIRVNSTKNGTWTAGQSLGALEFFGNDASGGQGAGLKGKIDVVSYNQYGAAFDMKFFTSNGSTDPTTENFKIAYDGGIFAPNLLGSSNSNPDVRYNTTTDELYYNSSSIRYKEDVTDLENSLDKINNLRPVKFKDKESGEYATGLIAEEVVNVLPELVFKRQIEGFNEPQIDGVSYGDLHAYYIKAIQQLKSEIETLKSQIN